MSATIRPFGPADYAGLTAVHNAVYPDYAIAAGELERQDGLREAKIRWGRRVAELDGEIVGWASYANSIWLFHPRKLWVEVMVRPEHRGQGLGRKLYDAVFAAVEPFEPIVLRSDVREDNEVGRGFAERRGFRVDQREQESRLDIRAFEPERFAADLERAEREGILLRNWTELDTGEDARRRLHAMTSAVAADVPASDPHTHSEFEDWEKRVLTSPNFLPDLQIFAVDAAMGEFVGISNLWKEATPGRLETGLTGVLRSHRKRGIATAMKVKALTEAKAAGFEATITWNEENNRGMLGINERLGFEKRPVWLMIENVLDAEALAASRKEES